jgi:hypothetical protein
MTGSFKRELLEGIHHLLTDVIWMALYTSAANIGPGTPAYVTDGEVSGVGYMAGGQPLLRPQVFGPEAGIAFVTWDDVVWPGATLTARGALLYNQTQAKRSVAVLDFVFDRAIAGGDFRVQLPPAGALTALIRIA